MFQSTTECSHVQVPIRVLVSACAIFLSVFPLPVINGAILISVETFSVRTTKLPLSLVLWCGDPAGYEIFVIPFALSYQFDSCVECSLSVRLILSPLAYVSVTVSIGNFPIALPAVLNPLPFVDVSIEVEHFAYSRLVAFVNLALVPFPIRVQIDALLVVEPILPFAHVNRPIASNQHADPIPGSILGYFSLVVRPIFIFDGLHWLIGKYG